MTKKRVREPVPVQVYLAADEQTRLERLAHQLETTKSEVVRQGLRALEREVLDPSAHPALRLIGLVAAESPEAPAYDAARQHDRFLAESEEETWTKSERGGRRAR